MGQFIIDFHVMYINTLLIALCATAAFARPQLVRPNDDRVPLDKNTKDQSKIVNHIKELINNVVAQEQEEVKVGNLQKPLEFYDTVIKAGDTTTTTTTTTTTRRTTTTTTTTTTQATTEDLGILPRIVNGITSAIGSIFNGGSFLGAAGSPLFGSIAIGRKKRSNSEEISNNLQIIRERLIRTGRDRDETEMIRKAVDAALDQLERRQEVEEMTDMKQIKEEIFLEIAKRLEQAKIDTAEIKDLRPLGLASHP